MSEYTPTIMERIAANLDDDSFVKLFSPDGLAPTAQWHCEDDWLVEYTTQKVRGGKLAGQYAVFVFQPQGPGSRKGKRGSASNWKRVKIEHCKTRREARARAEHHYYAHSPRLAEKHGKTEAARG